MPLKALFLDFYGTLVEPDETVIIDIASKVMEEPVHSPAVNGFVCLWHGHYVEAIRRSNEETFTLQHAMAIDTLGKALEDMEIEGDSKSICQAFAEFWNHPPKRDGADAFLSLHEIPLYLVSNIDDAYLMRALENLGWADHFSGIVTSENTTAYKPDLRLYEKALQLADVSPEEVVHVGDSWSADVYGPGKAGIRSVWLNPKGRDPKGGGDLLIGTASTLEEVHSLLENARD